MKAYLECGKIINTHGFRGTVKLESWCDSPKVLASLSRLYFADGDGFAEKKVTKASVFREFVLADIEGVEDEESANRLRGVTVYAAREDLPIEDGSYFIADLIGLPVRHADTGETIGKIADVRQGGAHDLYVVKTDTGEHLVPAVPAFIIRTDPSDAVYLRPIPGLLDNDAEEDV